MKQKAQKSLFSTKEEGDRNYRDMLELCKLSQIPYRVIKSTYTMRIESDFLNIHFVKSFMSDKAFIAAQMIKKDIKEAGILPPDIEMDSLKYFQFNQPDNLRNAPENVYNIDLKSAYANVLMNNGVISQKTFDFMKTLMKKDRLACVGMLAARKDVFCYGEDGKICDYSKEVAETANWFFWCVLQTGEIMMKLKHAIGGDFLFFWVDGIFFKGEQNIDAVKSILDELKYPYSLDLCSNFRYIEGENLKNVFYTKNNENKVVYLPVIDREEDRYLIDYLQIIKK